jgi:hypothetical protein
MELNTKLAITQIGLFILLIGLFVTHYFYFDQYKDIGGKNYRESNYEGDKIGWISRYLPCNDNSEYNLETTSSIDQNKKEKICNVLTDSTIRFNDDSGINYAKISTKVYYWVYVTVSIILFGSFLSLYHQSDCHEKTTKRDCEDCENSKDSCKWDNITLKCISKKMSKNVIFVLLIIFSAIIILLPVILIDNIVKPKINNFRKDLEKELDSIPPNNKEEINNNYLTKFQEKNNNFNNKTKLFYWISIALSILIVILLIIVIIIYQYKKSPAWRGVKISRSGSYIVRGNQGETSSI